MVREATSGDICGEFGVLCNRPQLFTIHPKVLCKVLRLSCHVFLNIIRAANTSDCLIIMNNFLQVCKANMFNAIFLVPTSLNVVYL